MISYRLFIVNSIFIFFTFSILFRVIHKNTTSLLEFILLTSSILIILFMNKLLVFKAKMYKKSLYYIVFLFYIVINILFFTVYRIVVFDIDLIDILIANTYQFKVTILSFFVFIIFFAIKEQDIYRLENIMILLLKIALFYTFFESFLSLIGFRSLFEIVYSSAGIVSDNLIDLKSLGLYRVWGLVGSTQLLGIYHVILFVYCIFAYQKNNFILFLSFIGIILSTSKTAYIILIIVLLLYLLVKKKYSILMLFFLLLSVVTVYGLTSLEHNFIDSFKNFFNIMTGKLRLSDNPTSYENMISNLQEYTYWFGQGLNYSYTDVNDLQIYLKQFSFISSDYTFMSIINQFGIIGFIGFSFIFLLYPFKNLLIRKQLIHNTILIVFYLSVFHYPILPSKLIMLYISYSIFQVYFRKDNKFE